jgi:ubiquinone/menaquinone biosynthesis C-methylase UbiE
MGSTVGSSASSGHEDQKESVAGVFGRAARTFDQTGPRFFTVFGERLAELADVRPGQTVLDVGCGRGASALPAARLAGPSGRVVAVDLAEPMVAELKRDANGLVLRNLEVTVMDAEDLLLPDCVVDRALGGFCLFFFPHPELALAEIRRVLRPDGRLALSTWDKRDDRWQWLDELTDAYLPAAAAVRSRDRREKDLTDSPSGMRTLLSRAGFERVEVVEESTTLTYSGVDEWWTSLWSRGRRRSLQRIEAAQGAEGLERFEADARRHLRTRGLLGPAGVHQKVTVLYSLASKPRG